MAAVSAVCNRIKQRGFTVETRLHMGADIRCNTKVLLAGQLDKSSHRLPAQQIRRIDDRFYRCASDQALAVARGVDGGAGNRGLV